MAKAETFRIEDNEGNMIVDTTDENLYKAHIATLSEKSFQTNAEKITGKSAVTKMKTVHTELFEAKI